MSHNESLERVLYIEDEEDIRIVADIALKTIGGLDTRCCASGPEGLATLETFPAQLILLDVMMPGMDGFQVCEKLKADVDTMHIRVVAMSGYHSAENERRVMDAGADIFLKKPFTNKEVLQACGFVSQTEGAGGGPS